MTAAESCAYCYESIPAGDHLVDHVGEEWPMHKKCGRLAGCPDGFESGPVDYYPECTNDPR
ncbi:hypothetical protein [Nocardia flavorosea]|uniref:Uncharacterized protein n=1 Tax=Nocardia flavorosea TaxID=53429 RepID=A0A846YMX4_9NOCA|nr:hypothetical protein [Nocardia flavorosea]NKY60395.1 hypothetical protein [Nocardia flavorosea]